MLMQACRAGYRQGILRLLLLQPGSRFRSSGLPAFECTFEAEYRAGKTVEFVVGLFDDEIKLKIAAM